MRYISYLGGGCCKIKFKNYVPKNKAKVGDIVVENGRIVKLADYNKQDKKAIGIVAVEPNVLPDGKLRVMSINYMNAFNLAEGVEDSDESGSWIYFGGYDTDGKGEDEDNLQNYREFSGLTPYLDTRYPICNKEKSVVDYLSESIKRIDTWGYNPSTWFKGQLAGPVAPDSDARYANFKSWDDENVLDDTEEWTKYDKAAIPRVLTEQGTINPYSQIEKFTIEGSSTETYFHNPLTEFDGASNTSKILETCKDTPTVELMYNNCDYTWDTAPAAWICNNFKKGGLKWYLPAMGEFVVAFNRLKEINKTRVALGLSEYIDEEYWTSTIYDSESAVGLYFDDGRTYGDGFGSSFLVVAFSAF